MRELFLVVEEMVVQGEEVICFGKIVSNELCGASPDFAPKCVGE